MKYRLLVVRTNLTTTPLLAALVAASGAAGLFYFAGAQEQAEITVVDNQPQPGSQIDVAGSNNLANSDVSIYSISTTATVQNQSNQTLPESNNITATTQNQTEDDDNNNQTATNGGASVRVEEAEAEPGEPLAISGDGFQPNVPVQIFINNVQITNIITNVEGSFNTLVVVPTTVTAGSAQVTVRTEQTNIFKNVNIVQPDERDKEPATVRFTSVSATDNARALRGAPVAVFDAGSDQMVDSGETPMSLELEEGTYSVFYSDFGSFDFQSAQPGRWTDTPDGGSGLITVREGRNATVTAMYSELPSPPPPPRETVNSITLRAQDTDGNVLNGMFATVYDDNGTKVKQEFTQLQVGNLPPGTYRIFYANFNDLVFVSASPGSWVQTPFGGTGVVIIPDDGKDHHVVVTATYDRMITNAHEQFNIRAPLDIGGDIFTITSNKTHPEGPFIMSGSFGLRVTDEDPLRASLSAHIVSVRGDSNENVNLPSQKSRDHDTLQIVDLDPQVARPVGANSYIVSGTADLLLNGNMYSDDERIHVMVRGGDDLTPTNIEIEFQGEHNNSAAHRLETLYGAVTSGFQ